MLNKIIFTAYEKFQKAGEIYYQNSQYFQSVIQQYLNSEQYQSEHIYYRKREKTFAEILMQIVPPTVHKARITANYFEYYILPWLKNYPVRDNILFVKNAPSVRKRIKWYLANLGNYEKISAERIQLIRQFYWELFLQNSIN